MKTKHLLKGLSSILVIILILSCMYLPLSMVTVSAEDPQYAPSGSGYRQNFSSRVCKPGGTNLIANSDCDDPSYWEIPGSGVTITDEAYHSGGTALYAAGGCSFAKTVNVLPNTTYYLSVWGMATGEPICDIKFGMMDMNDLEFENPLTPEEIAHPVNSWTRKQDITIQCQDGSWYNRMYKFETEDNTQLQFFIKSSLAEGGMYLDDISLFTSADSMLAQTSAPELRVDSKTVENMDCTKANNLIPNGDFSEGNTFWEDFPGFGEYVDIATTYRNRMLHYKSSGQNCYYLPYVTVQGDAVNGKQYTASFWAKNLIPGSAESHAKYGIASLNDPREIISDVIYVNSADTDWHQYAVTFTVYTETDIALAIYDDSDGGEALFDNIRLFETSKGVAASGVKPFGGDIITETTALGTDAPTTLVKDPSAPAVGYQSVYSKLGPPTVFRDLSGVAFNTFGENLFPDPTVSEFDEQGIYKEYFSATVIDPNVILNPKAWWDFPAIVYNGYSAQVENPASFNKFYTSARWSGYTINDPSQSHTDDGSGVIKIDRRSSSTFNSKYLKIPNLDAQSYYLISFWMKVNVTEWNDSLEIRSSATASYTTFVNYNYGYINNAKPGQWVQYTAILYTGNAARSGVVLTIPGGSQSVIWFDDFELYKLDDIYGKACIDAKYLVNTPMDTYSTALKVRSYGDSPVVDDVNWSDYGAKLYTDSTISRFVDGVYNDYYTVDNNQTVVDNLAFWDKPMDVYNFMAVTLCRSLKDRNLLSDDPSLSRINDGSGVIHSTTSKFHIPLPRFENYCYYSVSFWVKNVGNTGNCSFFTGGIDPLNEVSGTVFNLPSSAEGWKRINYVIYTGSRAYSIPNIRFDLVTEVYVDDIEVTRLSNAEYAENCFVNKRGDLNNDAQVNAVDVTKMRIALINNAAYHKAYDPNNDSKFDIRDLVWIKKTVLGLN